MGDHLDQGDRQEDGDRVVGARFDLERGADPVAPCRAEFPATFSLNPPVVKSPIATPYVGVVRYTDVPFWVHAPVESETRVTELAAPPAPVSLIAALADKGSRARGVYKRRELRSLRMVTNPLRAA